MFMLCIHPRRQDIGIGETWDLGWNVGAHESGGRKVVHCMEFRYQYHQHYLFFVDSRL